MDKPQLTYIVDIQLFPNLKGGQGQLGTAKWALLTLSSYDSYDRYCWQDFFTSKMGHSATLLHLSVWYLKRYATKKVKIYVKWKQDTLLTGFYIPSAQCAMHSH